MFSAVHTTGVNLEGVLANVVAITVIISFIGAVVGWALKNAFKEIVRATIRHEVTPLLTEIKDDLEGMGEDIQGLDTRVARLEGVEAGKQFAMAERTNMSRERSR